MAASRADLRQWFIDGVAEGATHMIVVCDTFDFEDYPVYVKTGEDFDAIYREHDQKNMQQIMEVYDLRMDREQQLNASRLVMNRP